MDSSRRAVESYWRSRMIDGATSDEDKVTPVYKLEEICELLRTSHVYIVKEVSDFVLKRLDHRSPMVKQKALRLIKYAVGKSGVEFRREMQRNSAAVRQLFHYKGQLDPLKGDALNKAVRDTAHEVISAIFSADDNKVQSAPQGDLNKRIQGFGNTNFEMPSEDKKSFLSEVVGIGSATLKQGLSSLTQSQLLRKNDSGSYKSPNLRRSLTTEIDYPDRFGRVEHHSEAQSALSRNVSCGPWGQDLRSTQTETTNGDASSSCAENKTREERLLETIVTSGGVRLQPTRDALQFFLVEASKLDAVKLSRALESKLLSPMWQVRMKAVSVLEAILRKKDFEHYSTVASYFSQNTNALISCSESPQASLKEKSNKVLSLLDGEAAGSRMSPPEKPIKAETTTFQMPDLIDTSGPVDALSTEDFLEMQSDQHVPYQKASVSPIFDDLFGDGTGTGESASERKNDDDPFADVSFHISENKENVSDIFSRMNADKPGANEVHIATNRNASEPFDIFGPSSEIPQPEENSKKFVHDLMAGLSLNENASMMSQNGNSLGVLSETILSDSTMNPSHQTSNNVLNGILGPQAAGVNANSMFPLGPMAYNMPPGLMFNPAFPPQPVNYGAVGSLFAHQPFLAAMSKFQQLGNLQAQNAGVCHFVGTNGEAYDSSLPDIFNPSTPTPTPTPSSMMNGSNKEETKAFDFISDHLAAARDQKRVI